MVSKSEWSRLCSCSNISARHGFAKPAIFCNNDDEIKIFVVRDDGVAEMTTAECSRRSDRTMKSAHPRLQYGNCGIAAHNITAVQKYAINVNSVVCCWTFQFSPAVSVAEVGQQWILNSLAASN